MTLRRLMFRPISDTPILPHGGTYGGTTVQAFAAPSTCETPSGFSMHVSGWDGTIWHSFFFTSTAFNGPYTYVTGSKVTPTAGLIIGNGGLIYANVDGTTAKYWWMTRSTNVGEHTLLRTSTDLVTWTTVWTAASGFEDPDLTYDTLSSLLEHWYVDETTRKGGYRTTNDGTTWTNHADILVQADWNIANFGELNSLRGNNGRRMVLFDYAIEDGYRGIGWAEETAAGVFTYGGSALGARPGRAEGSAAVFDGDFIGLVNVYGVVPGNYAKSIVIDHCETATIWPTSPSPGQFGDINVAYNNYLEKGSVTLDSVTTTTAEISGADATNFDTSISQRRWYRSTVDGFTPGAGNLISGSSTTKSDSGLSPSTTYYYRREDEDEFGVSIYTDQLTVTTPSAAHLGNSLLFSPRLNRRSPVG